MSVHCQYNYYYKDLTSSQFVKLYCSAVRTLPFERIQNVRKVFKNGNSIAVTVPKAYAHQLSIRDGSKIEWRQTEEGLLLTTKIEGRKPTDIDPNVAKLIKKLSRKYAGVWQDLAKV